MSDPLYVARAPVRVDPAGGGTDAPPFCHEYGGAVVNFGIAIHVQATLAVHRDRTTATVISHDLGQLATADTVDQLHLTGPLKLLCGIARRCAPPWGFTLEVESAMPPGSGLGSSGAVGVAVAGVLDEALGGNHTPAQIAELANSVERGDLGMSGGSQDSYGAALGGLNLITYHRGGGTSARPLKLFARTRHELERRSLLVYTGEVHLSGSIHADIKASYALPNSPTVDALRHLAAIALESAAALERGHLQRYGELLNDNWTHHQRLHPSCSNAVLDRYYEAAAPYVVGGKTCGAGGGGCILFLAQEGQRPALAQACRQLGGIICPFLIDPDGLIRYRAG
jgi:D-glycero-alpha-D-manno-heptose-7-phosphate kinase